MQQKRALMEHPFSLLPGGYSGSVQLSGSFLFNIAFDKRA
jgi:hypothetical protein